MEGIEISATKVGVRRDIALLSVKGYIDTQTCSKMLNEITSVLNDGGFYLIVNMSQVNYVSSAGWGVFVGEIKGIRERGGDLKIVEMTPEVNDVFEMLEFSRILEAYDSFEEAVTDFDLSIGLDLTKSISQSYNSSELTTEESAVLDPPKHYTHTRTADKTNTQDGASNGTAKIVELVLPVNEKIKVVITENPALGLLKIRQRLNTERFGNISMNLWRLYKTLRKLNLDTEEKRYRFYRSR